tara:strand:- start:677 stop:949 length:273 start_codon:yes stop_codon:yes gene_type:complete
MSNDKVISPCISICKSNPDTGYCYGCARSNEEKKIWKNPNTENNWKLENLNLLKKRMSESQLKTFERSYGEKLQFGKLVNSKNLKEKPQN